MLTRALATGCRLVARSWAVVLLLWALTLLTALPAALWMKSAVEQGIGTSRVHLDLRQRMDLAWLSEFHARAGELGDTLDATTTSRVDRLKNLESLLTGGLFEKAPGLVALGVLFALFWLLLQGGVIDRLARGGGAPLAGPFLGACGRYCGRLLRVTLLSLPIYWGLYELAAWSFDRVQTAARDVTAETTVFVWSLGVALPLVVLAVLVGAFFDYARVASVAAEESSALRSLGHAARVFRRHAVAVPVLALLFAMLAAGLVALRFAIDLPPSEATAGGILAIFAIGQLHLLARLALGLWATAAQLTVFRSASR